LFGKYGNFEGRSGVLKNIFFPEEARRKSNIKKLSPSSLSSWKITTEIKRNLGHRVFLYLPHKKSESTFVCILYRETFLRINIL